MLYSALTSSGPQLQRQLISKSWLGALSPEFYLTPKVGQLQKTSYIQILDTALSSDSEEVLGDESTDKEDWTCQEYLNDNGLAADYVHCDTCEHWFHKKFARKSELDVFSC